MNKIKMIFGYVWAVLAFGVVLATFFGSSYFPKKLAEGTGVTVSPRYTGGEIIRSIDHGAYKTHIHRPVFDGLINERRDGFIQINWEPLAGLPPKLQEAVSLGGESTEDFSITLDTVSGKAVLSAKNSMIIAVEKTYRLKNGWAARVELRRVN